MTQFHFRILLALSLLVGLAAGLVDLVVPSLIPESFRSVQEAEDKTTSTSDLLLILAVAIPALVVYLVSLFGLYQFRSWAPRAAVAGTALTLLVFPLIGTQTQSGLSQSLSYLASYLWGAVLVLSCTSPWSAWFTSKVTTTVRDNDA